MTESEKIKKLIDFADKKFANIYSVMEKMASKKETQQEFVNKLNESLQFIDTSKIKGLNETKTVTKILPIPQSGITTTHIFKNNVHLGRAKNLNFLSGATFDVVLQGDQANITMGAGGPGSGVLSVTGLDTDNTDPQNPIVQIAVDGVSITGDGTPGNPLVATGSTFFTTGVVPPASTPAAVGLGYIDTVTKFIYISTGTGSPADWTIINPPQLLIQ